MLFTSKAIVLHQVKYSDSSVIATFYTEAYGVKSFIVRGIKSGKGAKNKRVTLQPLAMVEITANHSEKASISTLRDIRFYQFLNGISSHPLKISVALFLQEVLFKTLREETANTDLFVFLENALLTLDTIPALNDFHLIFLVRLSKYFGFYPSGTANISTPVFSLMEGCFVPASRVEFALNLQDSQLLSDLKQAEYTTSVTGANVQRRNMLRNLIKFFQIHLEGMGTIRSLPVLENMFSGH